MSQSHFSETFGYGEEFQRILLAMGFKIPGFAHKYRYVLRPKYFDVGDYTHLCRVLYEHMEKYLTGPQESLSRDLVLHYCREQRYDLLTQDSLIEALDAIIATDTSEGEWVRDAAVDFAQRQERIHGVTQAAEALEKGDKKKFDKSIDHLNSVQDMSLGGENGVLFSDVAMDLPEMLRDLFGDDGVKIPTGIVDLDKHLLGGVGPGQIAVVLGPAKRGKSHFLVSVASAALRAGFAVHYYTIQDLKAIEVCARFASHATGVSLMELIADGSNKNLRLYRDSIKRWLDENKASLFVDYYTADTITAAQLGSIIARNSTMTEIKPSLIVLDYADLLSTGAKGPILEASAKSEIVGNQYLQLYKVLDQFDAAMWTASQVQATAWNLGSDKVIGSESYARSVQKINHAHVVVSLNQTSAEKEEGTARIYEAAFRHGDDGHVIPVSYNRSISRLEQCDESWRYVEGEEDGGRPEKDLSAAGDSTKPSVKSLKEASSYAQTFASRRRESS